MRILYMWDSDYPWDVRAEKICKSLIKHGYEVHIAARNLKGRPVYENLNGLHVHRIRTWRNNKVNYSLSFPAFFSPVWKSFIRSILKKYNIGLIIVRDLPLAPLGIHCARQFGIPCVFDMAEDYVELIRDIWNDRKFQGLNLVVRNPYFAHIVERYVVPRFSHVLVVTEEARDVAIRAGAFPQKITVVRNTPDLQILKKSSIKKQQLPKELLQFKDRYIAIYTGGIQMGRGLQLVFDAIPKIIETVPSFLFLVIGDGYAVEELQKIASEKGVNRFVFWAGWIAHEKLYQYISAANIGVIPHLRSPHVDTTVPNKIFDYMACGLPVIASDAPPLKRILMGTGAGVVYRSGEAKDFAQAVLQIFRNSSNYGARGQMAVAKKYNWKLDESRLINVVEHL